MAEARETHAFWPDRYSLRWRVSAAIAALVTGIVGTLVWVAYNQVSRTIVATGRDQAIAAATELANLVGQGSRPRLNELAALAADQAIRDCATSGNVDACQAAQARLTPLLKNRTQAVA